ncbi:Os08g0162066, partial [Oryza sativa Japonica Group]
RGGKQAYQYLDPYPSILRYYNPTKPKQYRSHLVP